MSTQQLAPMEVFLSYAEADEAFCLEMEKHLSMLKREGLIVTWHKRQLSAGSDWSKEIDEHLSASSIILLLLSADFVASDYCYGVEMQQAMERYEAGEAHVIPILLRPVDNWQGARFGKLQVLPRNGVPVTSWSRHDDALVDVAKGIREVLGGVQRLVESTSATTFSHKNKKSGVDWRNVYYLSDEQPIHETTAHEIINTHEALSLFHQLMQTNVQKRILCLVGEGKMGKSHLLRHISVVCRIIWFLRNIADTKCGILKG